MLDADSGQTTCLFVVGCFFSVAVERRATDNCVKALHVLYRVSDKCPFKVFVDATVRRWSRSNSSSCFYEMSFFYRQLSSHSDARFINNSNPDIEKRVKSRIYLALCLSLAVQLCD